ncbi:hypothetical protein GCM10007079_37250 [Nocardiopsis terrae]|uniref:Uncharacterized protein n=2 Tax=Nocardiopsis terrae TaxID=372655 RepID=A0ABR9HDK2_9ACTN|nr:hypothetical protein [Nocardiopsis terrae]GHC90738.1 hypothetical protein GCM10007079_37250 [Nocardiopsis terrae]
MPSSSPSPTGPDVPAAAFEEMLRAARALLAMRHPLDAELAFSELLGSWWGERLPGVDVERLLGEGLITHATAAGKPAGLGVLAAITALGTSASQRELAEQGMIALRERGLQAPAWASQLGAVTPVSVYVNGDRFGDTDDVVCVFSRDAPDSTGALPPEHALILVVDHNSGGLLRDAWVTTKVDLLLEQCREQARADGFARFEQLELSEARSLLTRALERTERVVTGAAADPSAGPTVEPVGIASADLTGGSLAAHFALAASRVQRLPRPPRGVPDSPVPVWRRDRRAVLAARFLASDQAAELSDSYAASRCADHIITHGCDVDSGRPMRVSPRKVESFLLHWLPGRVVLLPEEQEAMPHVLAAWVRWAGARTRLPEVAVGATLDALWEATSAFAKTYRDPARPLGLRQDAVRRLLPDGDFASLARRMFAFPLLASELVTGAPEEFDPATSRGRRALLRLDHYGEYEAATPHSGRHHSTGQDRWYRPVTGRDPGREEELDRHERLAKRLWDGRPANLWAAARRMLDRGADRPTVLAALVETLYSASSESDLRRRLDAL